MTGAPTPVAGRPTTPPAQICGNAQLLTGPAAPPAGAVVVAAGNNGGVDFSRAGTTYWFAPGLHTLGTSDFDQIIAGTNSTYVGGPGAILDGQNRNLYAFTQQATGVAVRFLTIRNFGTRAEQQQRGRRQPRRGQQLDDREQHDHEQRRRRHLRRRRQRHPQQLPPGQRPVRS